MKLDYSDTGSGFPIVLLHGFCETRAIWDNFACELSKNYRVLTPDLPGFGKSALPSGKFSLDDIAKQVYDWLLSLEIKKTVIIAHSLGGYVALALAKKHPGIFAGFGLFHSTALADNEEKKASRNKVIEFIESKGADTFARSFVPQLFYIKNRARLASEIEKVVNIAAATSKETLIAYTKAMRDREDRTDVLKTFEQPILIIAGDKDTAVPIETIGEQELLPKKAIVYILDETGHMGMFEKTEQTLNAVKHFLSCTKSPS